MLNKIEHQFYWNEAGHDFDIAIIVNPFLAIAMGKKSRLTVSDLYQCLSDAVPGPWLQEGAEKELRTRDIIVLSEHEDHGPLTLIQFASVMERVYPENN